MEKKPNPIRETTDEARALGRSLIAEATYGALGVTDPETGAPTVSRVAVALTPTGQPVTLISDLSHHTVALKENPVCSLLVGEPGEKGDPLTHPRITLQAEVSFVRHGEEGHKTLRSAYLKQRPKAGLYIDFADFSFAIFDIRSAYLNGGFGQAYILTAEDLR